MQRWRSAGLVFLAAGLVGCGKSAADAVAESRAYFDEVRPKLAAVAKAVEAAPEAVAAGPCAPGAKLDADPASAGYNVDLLHLEQLTDIDTDLAKVGRAVDLSGSSAFRRCLEWTGPRPKLDPSVSGAAVAERLARCRGVSHLLVARERGHDRAKAELRMRYDLVRIADAAVLCSFELASTGDPTLGVLSYEITRPGSTGVVKSEKRDEYATKLAAVARQDFAKAAEEILGVRFALPR